jgi:hypothetical protein
MRHPFYFGMASIETLHLRHTSGPRYRGRMKTRSLLRAAVLLALLFGAATAAAATADVPFPAPLAGIALVALALRLGVMVESARPGTPAPAARPLRPSLQRAA